jgi:hypothetical protein
MPALSSDFNWPRQGAPTSTVVRSVQGLPPSEYELLLPHESIRFLMNELRAVLKNFEPLRSGKKWQAKCLSEWLDSTFFPIVHYHHLVEEEDYGPELEKRGVKLPPAVGPDHERLMPELERLMDAARAGFKNEPQLQQWKNDLSTLFEDFEEHMAYEEREYPKATKLAQLSEQQNAEAVQAMVAKIPGWVQGLEFPCIIYNMHVWYGSTEEITERLALMGVPGIVIGLLNWRWLPHFFEDTLARLDALKHGDTPYLAPGCCF